MPKAKLIINGGESEVSIGEGVTSIGRVADNTVSLAGDSNVSRYHIEIETRGQNFWLIELGSSNGTTVNGERIYDEKLLKDGDEIVLGGSSEIFFELEKVATQTPESTGESESASLSQGSSASLPDASAANIQTPSVLPNASAPEIPADTEKASKFPVMLAVMGIVCGLAIVCVVGVVAFTLVSKSSKCEAKAKIVSPESGDLIIKETEIELDAKNTDCVKRAIFLMDGEVFATSEDAPYTVSLDPKQLAQYSDGQNHSLKIVFEDIEGNQIVQPDEVLLAFETASTPTPTPTPDETLPDETPTPKKKDEKKQVPTDTAEMCRALVKDLSPNANYKFSPEFVQEVQKHTSEYASDGFFARAGAYRDVINVMFQETGVGVPLGYVSAMSRSQFKLQNQGNEQGLWRMNNDLVTAKGYNGLCGGEPMGDAKQSCAARAASLYIKDLVIGIFEGDVVYGMAAFGMSPQDASDWKNSLGTADRADFWKAIKSKEQRDTLARFFAAGIVANNPKKFGLKNDQALSELYKNFVTK